MFSRRIAATLLGAGAISMLSGCAVFYTAPVIPPQGLLFSSVSAPVDTDTESTPVSYKTGEATSMSVLWLFAFGDASIQTAAEDGGLTTIEHVDHSFFHVLGLYQQFTIKVYGE